jgi:hypothetical protein
VIYSEDPNNLMFFTKSGNGINLELDILGSSFFMITHYEEVVKIDQDHLDRFLAKAFLAYQENFLNEYLESLWACLHELWPTLQQKRSIFVCRNCFELVATKFCWRCGETRKHG